MKVSIFVFCVALTGCVSARTIRNAPIEPKVEQTVNTASNDEQTVVVVNSNVQQQEQKENSRREKRQFGGFGGQNYGQSSALANANSFNQYQGPGGFGGSSGIAGAQAFNSQGPLGGFGASAANTATQGFHAGPGGIQGSAGFSGSQSYNLPNKQNVNIAYGGTQGFNNGQGTGGASHSISYSK